MKSRYLVPALAAFLAMSGCSDSDSDNSSSSGGGSPTPEPAALPTGQQVFYFSDVSYTNVDEQRGRTTEEEGFVCLAGRSNLLPRKRYRWLRNRTRRRRHLRCHPQR